MTTVEQILLKLGIDQSQVGPGLDSFKNKVQEATGHAHQSFLHGTSGPRAFHQMLHKITEASPVMGMALQTALNPIGGVLLAAGAVFAYFNRQIEKANEELDKMAAQNAKPFSDLTKAARETTDEVAKLNREFEHWAKGKDRTVEKITDELDDQVSALESQQRVNEKLLEQDKQKKLNQISLDVAGGRMSQGAGVAAANAVEKDFAEKKRASAIKLAEDELKAQQDNLMKLSDARKRAADEVELNRRGANNPHTVGEIARLKAIGEGAQRGVEEGQAEIREKLQALTTTETGTNNETGLLGQLEDILPSPDPSLKRTDWSFNPAKADDDPLTKAKKELQRARDLQAKHEEALVRAKKELAEYTATHEVGTERLKESQKKLEDLTSKFDSASKAVEKTRVKLDELNKTPAVIQQQQLQAAALQNLPTVDQLATAGTWTRDRRYGNDPKGLRFHPGPYAAEAQELKMLEERSPWDLAMGKTAWHNADELRIQQIKDQFVNAGVQPPGSAEAKMETHLQTISSAVKDGVMNVRVGNVD